MPLHGVTRAICLGLVAGVIASALAGCSALSQPITLTLGVADSEGSGVGTEDAQARHFADEVAAISDGAVTIEVEYNAQGDDGALGWNQSVAVRVANGELDLALVPSRAWDSLGVDSLRALNAPFLITSRELTDAVVGSDDLRARLLSGLPDAGVVALDLFPEELRHPFGFAAPLLAPADYEGAVIRSPKSETVWAMFAALGADVVDASLEIDSMAADGMESAYSLTRAFYVAGNVTFFPKVNVLAAHPEMYGGLSDGQRKMLADASSRTREWAFGTVPTEVDGARGFCGLGGTIGEASATEIAALESAAAEVTENLLSDPLTAALISDIEALKRTVEASPPVTSCDGMEPQTTASAMNGVFEVTVTREELEAAGVTSEKDLRENTGTWTWTFRDGLAKYTMVAPDIHDGLDHMGYTLDESAFRLTWNPTPSGWTAADVAIQPDGSLVFTNIVDGDPSLQVVSEVLFGLHPWVRVGEP